MKQTPAALLVLSSAVFSFAAQPGAAGTSNQGSAVMALAAIATALVGSLALVSSLVREREQLIDKTARLDVFNRLFAKDPQPQAPPAAAPDPSPQHVELSDKLRAQLNVVAQMEGRSEAEVLEQTLRKHLPRYAKPRAA